MPQWRKLHAKFVDSEDVNDMPDDFTRLTWAIMPVVLDSEGRAQDDATWLRSKLYPKRRDVSLEMIEMALSWYADRRMLVRYQAVGRRYLYVPTFKLYQGKTDREAASVIPEPPKRSQFKANSRRKAPTTPPVDALSRSGLAHELVQTGSTLDSEEIQKRGDSDSEESKDSAASPPRRRDPVFDAIVEVCAVDLSIDGSNRSVGAVAVALKKASPPYSGEEILAWGQEQAWRSSPPTVWQLKQGVSTIRRTRKASSNGQSRRSDPPGGGSDEPASEASRIARQLSGN